MSAPKSKGHHRNLSRTYLPTSWVGAIVTPHAPLLASLKLATRTHVLQRVMGRYVMFKANDLPQGRSFCVIITHMTAVARSWQSFRQLIDFHSIMDIPFSERPIPTRSQRREHLGTKSITVIYFVDLL